MPPKKWEEEDEDESSSPAPSPPVAPVRRGKFEDEEEDEDVVDDWDAADDTDAEKEKAKKAAEAKAKAEAEAAAKKKSKAQRIAEHKSDRARRRLENESSDEEDETPAQRRERLKATEKEADLRHAEDLFGDAGMSAGGPGSGSRTAPNSKASAAVWVDPNDPSNIVTLSSLAAFNPTTKAQFETLREVLAPALANNAKKPHYVMFLQELFKTLARDLQSDQVKKLSSTLTALGNEKQKEEKSNAGLGKKTKAQKTKNTLVTGRVSAPDTKTYDDAGAFGEDDFM